MTTLKQQVTATRNEFQAFLNGVLLEQLTEQQRRIAASRQRQIFGFDVPELTLREIAKREGLGAQSVRMHIMRIQRKIKRKLLIIKESLLEPQVIVKYVEKSPEKEADKLPVVYKPIEALGEISCRTHNCLHVNDIKTVEQLIQKTDGDLLRIPNFGRKSLNEVIRLLRDHGLELTGRS